MSFGNIPEDRIRTHHVNVSPRFPAVDIKITGNRDRRGADNNVYVWLDERDQLHIQVYKANRCYQFKEMIDHFGSVEIIQV